MSTGTDDMNARLRTRRDSPEVAALRARLMDTDPDVLLDELAAAAQRDPAVLTRLDAATRQHLGTFALAQRALVDELAARQQRRRQDGQPA